METALTFRLQRPGSQLPGQLHELTVLVSHLLVVGVHTSFLLFGLRGNGSTWSRDGRGRGEAVLYLLSEPLLPFQALLPPLDLGRVHVVFIAVFVLIKSPPLYVKAFIWSDK